MLGTLPTRTDVDPNGVKELTSRRVLALLERVMQLTMTLVEGAVPPPAVGPGSSAGGLSMAMGVQSHLEMDDLGVVSMKMVDYWSP